MRCPMSRRFLGIVEAAEYLDMSQRWMYRDSQRYGLPRYYFGGRLKFKVEDLERWVQQQKVS